MDLQEKIAIITQIITLVGILFAVYLYFKKPQIKGEENDLVFNEKLKGLEKTMNEIKLNDLHELKGMFNTHITNQNVCEREVSDKLARVETKLDMLLKK